MGADWAAGEGERLATEWDRDVPSDDTMLRAYVDALAEMVGAQARAIGGRVLGDDTVMLADADSPGAYLNAAVLLAPLREHETVDAIARMSEFFAGGSQGRW